MDLTKTCWMSSTELSEFFTDAMSEETNITTEETNTITYEQFLLHHGIMCDRKHFEWIISWLVPVIFAVIVGVGIIGNVLVLIVVACRQQMRNTTNILIVNLATSDLLFVTICIPPTAVDYAMGWPLGDVCCKLVQYLIHVTTYGSVYTLVLLSLDRYLAVVYPVRSISIRTVCNTSIVVLITWIFTLATCVPVLFLFRVKEIAISHDETMTVCSFSSSSANEKVFQSVFFATSLALPLAAILWLYMNMLVRLWRGTAATHGPGPMRDTRNACKGKENKLRVTRMIVVVIIVFALCWTPLQVVLLLKSHDRYNTQTGNGLLVLQIVANCLAYCNSCLNPILYAFFSPNFRTAFMNAVSCSCGAANNFWNGTGLNNNKDVATGTPDRRQSGADGESRALRTKRTEIFATATDADGFDIEMQPLVTIPNQAPFVVSNNTCGSSQSSAAAAVVAASLRRHHSWCAAMDGGFQLPPAVSSSEDIIQVCHQRKSASSVEDVAALMTNSRDYYVPPTRSDISPPVSFSIGDGSRDYDESSFLVEGSSCVKKKSVTLDVVKAAKLDSNGHTKKLFFSVVHMNNGQSIQRVKATIENNQQL